MKITNTQLGPRGVNAVSGAVLVEPGQTWEGDVYERERQHIEASGWFRVDGDFTANPGATLTEAKADASGNAGEIAELKKQLAARDTRIAELEKLVPAVPKAPFEAKQKSPGWFVIYDTDGREIGKAFREAEATAFNALDDSGKQGVVDEAQKAAA